MATDVLLNQGSPSLINGISQQPANARLTSQAEEQINILSDVADGIKIRPPMEFIKKLGGSAAGAVPTGGYKIHTINRGNGQQFFALVKNGDINVFDLNGDEVVVNDGAAGSPGSYTYLDYDTANYSAEEAFALATVADYTFVLNRTKTAALSGTPSAGRTHAHEFLLVIGTPGAGAGVNKITMTFDTSSVTNAGSPTTSEALADALCLALCGVTNPSDRQGTAGGSINDWKFTRVSTNIIHGYQFQNPNDLVKTSDALGDTLHKLYATGTSGEPPTAPRFSDLPAKGLDGFSILIKGDKGFSDDDFWVVYSDTDHIWKESVKPGIDNNFNVDTLPHALVYDVGTGQFTFQPIAWKARLVGDTDSAPVPSFVGKTIKDILVHKNRLTVVSQENVICSESGEFFNFWPTTVTALLDSDPIDIAGTGNTVAIWDHALPFLGNLTLFSSTGKTIGELVGSREDALTIKNARIVERQFVEHSKTRPISAGNALYFLVDRGVSNGLFIYNQEDLDLFRANEITSHVKKFLPPNVDRCYSSTTTNILGFLSTSQPTRAYIYRYHFLGDEQVMSSWSYWQIDALAKFLSFCWIGSVLYAFIERSDGVHLEKMDFGITDEDRGATGSPLGYRVALDSLLSLTGSYNAGTGITTWTIPFNQFSNGAAEVWKIFRGGAWGSSRGLEIPVLFYIVDGQITATGNWSAAPVYIGRVFDWTYEFSQFFVRQAQTATSSAKTRLSGRLQLRRGRVIYKDTGAFNVEIRSRESGDTTVYTDSFASPDGVTAPAKGTFEFDIGGDSRNVRVLLKRTNCQPAQFSALEWDGLFYQHSTPI